MSRKLVALFLGVMLVFVALAIDITYVNATKGEKYERQVLSQTQQSYDSRTIPFQRGSITDRNGTILATSEKVYNVILDCKLANTTVKDEEKNDTHPYVDPTVAALVEYFGLDETDIRDRLTGETTKESQYQVLAREVSMDAKKAFETYVDEYADKKNKELDENEQAEKAYRANIRGVWFEVSVKFTCLRSDRLYVFRRHGRLGNRRVLFQYLKWREWPPVRLLQRRCGYGTDDHRGAAGQKRGYDD